MNKVAAVEASHLLVVAPFLAVIVALGFVEPLQELLGSETNLSAGADVDVFLARLLTPRLGDLLADEVVLVVAQENGRHLSDQFWMIIANKSLCTAKESLHVLLGLADHGLEHTSPSRNLLDNILVKDGLSQNSECLVLGLDAQLLGLLVDVNIIHLADGTFVLGLIDDPGSKLVVGIGTILFSLFIIVEGERTLQVRWKFLSTSSNSFSRRVNSPFLFLGRSICVDVFSNLLNLLGELVVTASCNLVITVVSVSFVGVGLMGASPVHGTILLALAFGAVATGLLFLLCLFSTFIFVLENKSAQFVAYVNLAALTASLAVQQDAPVLNVDLGLGVLARFAENKSGNEAIQGILELACIMSSIDDPTIVFWVGIGLSTEFEAEVFDHIGRRTS